MGNGGVKRGVLQSTRRLTAEAIGELKKAWKRLYEQNNDCIILNEGITYHELQQTDAGVQMIESKNAIDADICRLFNVPVNLFNSTIPEDVEQRCIRDKPDVKENEEEIENQRSLVPMSWSSKIVTL